MCVASIMQNGEKDSFRTKIMKRDPFRARRLALSYTILQIIILLQDSDRSLTESKNITFSNLVKPR